MKAIVMAEEFWANSQFSIVRYTGQCVIDGKTYIIVDKLGRDIFQLSALAEKEGRSKAIEPGEPADLVDSRYVKAYRMMGRDAFLSMIESTPEMTVKKANELAAIYAKEHKQETPQSGDKFAHKE